MNIFHKTALQSLKKNRTRTLVTIFGAALSAAMITASSAFGVSLLHYLAEGAAQKYGGWHVEFLDVPASFVQERAGDEESAQTAVFEEIGYARLTGGKNPDKPYLFVAGCGEEALRTLPIRLVYGRMPENSSEILVPGSVAENGGVKIPVGETICLDTGDRISGGGVLGQHDPYLHEKEELKVREKRTYTVVGIYQRPPFEEFSAPGYTLITKMDDMRQESVFSVFVTLKNPYQVRSYAQKTAGNFPYVFNDDVLRFLGVSGDQIFNTLLYTVCGIVIIIIMTGSVFLIYNVFHISLNERTHQFGILLSIGATAKQLRGSVLFEGFCIGAAGIPAGIIIGLAGMHAVLSIASESFGDVLYDSVPLVLVISPPLIAASAAISLITILVSAYIPARRAASMPVMECIRQTNEVRMEARTVKTPKYVQHIYGLEGMLALKNYKRNKKRHRSIILSLVLSIVLFITTNAFITDLKQIMNQSALFQDYDIGFAVKDMEDSEMLGLYEKIKKADGVLESSYQALVSGSVTVQAADVSDALREAVSLDPEEKTVQIPVEIQFLEDRAYEELIRELGLPAQQYTGRNAKLAAYAEVQGAQEDETVEMFDAEQADLIFGPQSVYTVTAVSAGLMPPDTLPEFEPSKPQPYLFRIMAPYSRKEELVPSDVKENVKGVTLRCKNAVQAEAEIRSIIMGENVTAKYSLYNIHSMFEQEINQIFIADLFSYTFIVLISLIAAANVFNTISTNIKLRRRELGMLRSAGMSERSFQKMMRFECVFYGTRALIFGLPAALLGVWAIYHFMSMDMDGLHFVLPWAGIGISIFSVMLVIFAAMMYAVRSIKKENIIDVLRDDMF